MYRLIDVIEVLQAQVHPNAPSASISITTLAMDSRQIAFSETALFFAIRGIRHDGHLHIKEAYQKGIRYFVVDHLPKGYDAMSEAFFLQVTETTRALQNLAAFHRSHFRIPVLGITGSNGKTTIKEWLYQLLQPDISVVKSPRSFNSQYGVPLSVWQMEAHHQWAIFEAGISQRGEMAFLEAVIQPTVGIFTNIGAAHSEGFSSDEEKILEKMTLFSHCETLICCGNHLSIIQATSSLQGNLYTWAFAKSAFVEPIAAQKYPYIPTSANVWVRKVQFLEAYGLIEVEESGILYVLNLPLSGYVHVENAMHCVAFLRWKGMSWVSIETRLMQLSPIAMRLEVKQAIGQSVLINDSYNSDLTSLLLALQFQARQTQYPKKTLVLSDILQSGQSPTSLYQEVGKLLHQYPVDKVIGIGTEIKHLAKALKGSTIFEHYEDTASYLAQVVSADYFNESILLKGARPFGFERIAQRLELQIHSTRMEINLDALQHNLSVYRNRLSERTGMMLMVKAAAYGSGSSEVARILAFQKVDYLGVAYVDEGIELRQQGIQLPIMVLRPSVDTFDALLRFGLEPEVYSLQQLRQLCQFMSLQKAVVMVHLKVDTGMHRLGIEPQEVPEVLELLLSTPNIQVAWIFSHLAASEDPADDAFTHEQARRFELVYRQISMAIGYSPKRHLCNSSGIVRFPEYHFDMVRLGIGVYGVDSSRVLNEQLHVVATLKATISQVKTIEAGETIGYNRRGKVAGGSRVATISIGYADGFQRHAGHGKSSVLIHGQMAPTVGSICMDMCMVDVSHIKEAQEGDEVVVFGALPTVQSLAQVFDTIPYEVLTGISSRVKRIYFQE